MLNDELTVIKLSISPQNAEFGKAGCLMETLEKRLLSHTHCNTIFAPNINNWRSLKAGKPENRLKLFIWYLITASVLHTLKIDNFIQFSNRNVGLAALENLHFALWTVKVADHWHAL